VAKILVVEDDPNNLELAREHRPELILLDLQLPKLDGWTVVKLLRKEPWAKVVPIVAVSASASPGDEHKALEAGCTHFLRSRTTPQRCGTCCRGTCPRPDGTSRARK
jgi:CheY-like chemotaxis protein